MVAARRVAVALAGFQAVDALVCAIPNGPVKADLDRIGCPPSLSAALPFIKGASATGLALGLKRPAIGKLTAASLIAYFVVAIGFHARAGDRSGRYLPAVGVLVWSAGALQYFRHAPAR